MKKLLAIFASLTVITASSSTIISCFERYTSAIDGIRYAEAGDYFIGKKTYLPVVLYWPKEGEKYQIIVEDPEIAKVEVDEDNFIIIEGLKAGETSMTIKYKGARSQSIYLTVIERTNHNEIQELSSVLINTNLGEFEKNQISDDYFFQRMAELNPKLIINQANASYGGFKIISGFNYPDYEHQLPKEYFPTEEEINNENARWDLIWAVGDSEFYQGKPVKVTYIINY